MGYASYLEDIIDRLTSDFDKLKKELSSNKPISEYRVNGNLQWLIKKCDKIIEELLEIATNPNVEPILKILTLENEVHTLNKTVDNFRKRLKMVEEQHAKTIKQLIEQKKLNAKLMKDNQFYKNQESLYQKSVNKKSIKFFKGSP